MDKEFFWHEWLCHTNYSFLRGGSYPSDYVERAYALGYQGVGICDYNGVYGLVQAYSAYKKIEKNRHEAGIFAPPPKLFNGIEFSLSHDPAQALSLQSTIVLMAQSKRGYQTLCALATIAHKEGEKKPFLPLSTLENVSKEGLICLQPMRGYIRCHKPEDTLKHYQKLKELFSGQFYLVLSRHLNPIEDRWIKPTLALAQKLSLPTLFSQDAYFHQPEDKYLHDILQAIRLNEPIDRIVPHLFVNEERCLRDLKVLENRYKPFAQCQAILKQGRDLAETFQFTLQELIYHYPQEFIPVHHTPQSFLEQLVWEGAQKRYPEGCSAKVKDLLDKELVLVADLKFVDYFLTVWDIVRWARAQNILCQGRGSAANSVICYVLGITALDPETSELLFERFLSRERGEPPDIDIDFEHERREEVIQYIYSRYGRHRAAMVANVICFRGRSAFRSIGKAFGVPEVWMQQIAEHTSMHRREKNKPSLPEELTAGIAPYCDWELWTKLSERLEGFPRHLGIHSGGFVISNEAMDNICGQEPATMEGRTVLQWSKDDIETLNIFKIDILALGMLTALRKGFATIQEYFHTDLRLDNIPTQDTQTFAMIQKGDTVGTFQIESRAQMSMLPRLKPEKFYDLVVQVGIIRPGPIQGGLIHPYIRRRQGLEAITYPDPRVEPILKRTLGIPIFQEQIMRVAMELGGFSPGEADELRKKIGAWSLGKDFGNIISKLTQGLLNNNVQPQFAEQIIGYLQGFASYGFPESHSASFALLAYASSYMKCHFPEAFYMALINSQPMGFYSVHALIQSARREGVGFLAPDINKSHWDSCLERVGERPLIRLGFHLVRGLAEQSMKDLTARRSRAKDALWTHLEFFLRDSEGINRKDLSALAAANALQNFGIERREALWLMETFPRAPLLETEHPYQFESETALERMERDFEAFSSTLDHHPTVLIKKFAWHYAIRPHQLLKAKELLQAKAHDTIYVFGMVLIRQSPPTAKGILFVTLEDDTGFVNLVCKPKTIELFRDILWQHSFLCVSGRLQRDQDSVSILVEHAYRPVSEIRPITQKAEPGPKPEQWENSPPVRNFR
ncbi:MAG: error-prone DNA polymerase [Chitinophagaceae bacterium]|nr:error-prone DNA polymerase [Oligoflexus sp.]